MEIRHMPVEIKVPNDKPSGTLDTTEAWGIELKS